MAIEIADLPLIAWWIFPVRFLLTFTRPGKLGRHTPEDQWDPVHSPVLLVFGTQILETSEKLRQGANHS